jgi:hypothetical protein
LWFYVASFTNSKEKHVYRQARHTRRSRQRIVRAFVAISPALPSPQRGDCGCRMPADSHDSSSVRAGEYFNGS